MFLHRLARDLGRLDVDAMAMEMTWPQMLGWAAFYLDEASKQDPEPNQWDDEQAAVRKLQRKADLNAGR